MFKLYESDVKLGSELKSIMERVLSKISLKLEQLGLPNNLTDSCSGNRLN